MSQNPNQPPQPQWDPQQGRWVLPGQQGPQGPGGTAYGQQQYGQGAQQGYGQQGPYGVPGHIPPPPPPPRKTRKWPWVVGGLAVLLIIAASCTSGNGTSVPAGSTAAAPALPASSSSVSSSSATSSTSESASGQVVYEVIGTGTAMNITYGDVTKGLSQLTKQKLPWTKSAASTEGFAAYGVTAQNGAGGEISCKITLDGKEIAANTSSGQYAVVSCNGSSSPFG